MTELELKFRLDAEASHRWRALFEAQGAARLRLRARYFDTAASALGTAGVALRLRLEGTRWVQTLKASGESAVHRLEHEVDVDAASGNEPPALDLSRHEGSAVYDRLQRVLQAQADRQLVPRYETDVQRSIVRLRDEAGGSDIEAALDLGRVLAGDRVAAVAELELEHVAGRMQELFTRAQQALGLGGMWLSTISKAEQGETLRRGTPAGAAGALPLAPRVHAGGAALLRAVLHNVMAQVLPNASRVAEGDAGAEHVHQLRIGLRRLRTALRELAPLSARIDPAWEPVLASVFRQLGERRDDEVVSQAVRPLLEAAGAPKLAWAVSPGPDLVRVVRDAAFQRTLVEVLALAHAGDEAFVAWSPRRTKSFVTGRLRRLYRQVTKDGRRFETLRLVRQHRVRKRLKRLRYLCEFAKPLWRHARVDHYVAALKPAQDALGWHSDCATAAGRFARDAERDAAAQFAAGYLKAHLAITARAARRQLRSLETAEPFWARRSRQ